MIIEIDIICRQLCERGLSVEVLIGRIETIVEKEEIVGLRYFLFNVLFCRVFKSWDCVI